jgi:hypothetical protein
MHGVCFFRRRCASTASAATVPALMENPLIKVSIKSAGMVRARGTLALIAKA